MIYKSILNTIKAAALILLMGINADASAHNKVVVVPLGGGESAPMKNVIRVSAKNGDFTSIAGALASITDSTTNNTYLVLVGPGTFHNTSTMIIPTGVSLVGSGFEQTAIFAQVTHASSFENAAAVFVSHRASISNLAISNIGFSAPGELVVGVFLEDEARADSVEVFVNSSGTINTGVASNVTTIVSARINNSKIVVENGTSATGVLSILGTLEIRDSLITASSASLKNTAVLDSAVAEIILRNSVVNATGTNSTGIEINSIDTKITQVQVDGATADVVDNQALVTNCLDVFDSALTFLGGC